MLRVRFVTEISEMIRQIAFGLLPAFWVESREVLLLVGLLNSDQVRAFVLKYSALRALCNQINVNIIK